MRISVVVDCGVIDDALICSPGGRHPGASSLLSSSSGDFKRPTFTGDCRLSYIATIFCFR
ncbi:hypothetical protein Hanom_Chr15g01365221 [Helianthus anomalus]